jgi:hypothetical protein
MKNSHRNAKPSILAERILIGPTYQVQIVALRDVGMKNSFIACVGSVEKISHHHKFTSMLFWFLAVLKYMH